MDYLKERLRETKTVKFFDNRYSIYLFYWYKSTNTDTALSIYLSKCSFDPFTGFTGTKVQILKLFFRTHRQHVLSLLALPVQSTNADTELYQHVCQGAVDQNAAPRAEIAPFRGLAAQVAATDARSR